MSQSLYIGPFKQVISFANLPHKGPITDSALDILDDYGILIKGGKIKVLGSHPELHKEAKNAGVEIVELKENHVVLPGYVDAHTHICFAGSRAADYAARNAGTSYLEIAKAGGGIWHTVKETRAASMKDLVKGIEKRSHDHLKNGVTTIEVKSGYGLNRDEELKMLRAIKTANSNLSADLIPTCLAAHLKPQDFPGDKEAYLSYLCNDLLPVIKEESLTNRIDIFVEESAFNFDQGLEYLNRAKEMGFSLTVHADQFSVGGSALAIRTGAVSADHLEASGDSEIRALAASEVTGIALPGASLGLGCPFTPARKLLDYGGALAIASDHNPGSAPMGRLVTQAAILGCYEKLTNAEVLSGITFRAANALGLKDRGRIAPEFWADLVLYNTDDYREILYHQGSLEPNMVIKRGEIVYSNNS